MNNTGDKQPRGKLRCRDTNHQALYERLFITMTHRPQRAQRDTVYGTTSYNVAKRSGGGWGK